MKAKGGTERERSSANCIRRKADPPSVPWSGSCERKDCKESRENARQPPMGTAYAAFVIDVFARKIVGWRVSTLMTTSFVLDALNQAICQRRPAMGSLTHHSDRGMHCASIRYANRLAEAGSDMSVGSIGDSYDNALAETVIGLFKTEVVKHLGPWKTKACSNGKP